MREYPQARRLHVILDNYRIHTSEIVQAALSGYLAGKVELHFLPPYCPDHNEIERVWQDLHANVTRNHRGAGMNILMQEVRYYLRKRNQKKQRLAKAAQATTCTFTHRDLANYPRQEWLAPRPL